MPVYLQPDLIERAEKLGLQARTIVEGVRVGDHKSPFRGFSIEFIQHREYVPGDDTRHIDWKVYGRAERYTIKQYEQETNFVAHLLLDASQSMSYGTGAENKLEYAKVVAASLVYLILRQRDSASLGVFDTEWQTRVPPSGQPGQMQIILRALAAAEPRTRTSIAPRLRELAETGGRRGLVFLLTDGFDDVGSTLAGLQHLRFLGHEVTVFQVLHADERHFPFDGLARFEGLEETREVLTRPRLIRPAYLKALEAHQTQLRSGCEAIRCDHVVLDTSRPVSEALIEYLARRQRLRQI